MDYDKKKPVGYINVKSSWVAIWSMAKYSPLAMEEIRTICETMDKINEALDLGLTVTLKVNEQGDTIMYEGDEDDTSI